MPVSITHVPSKGLCERASVQTKHSARSRKYVAFIKQPLIQCFGREAVWILRPEIIRCSPRTSIDVISARCRADCDLELRPTRHPGTSSDFRPYLGQYIRPLNGVAASALTLWVFLEFGSDARETAPFQSAYRKKNPRGLWEEDPGALWGSSTTSFDPCEACTLRLAADDDLHDRAGARVHLDLILASFCRDHIYGPDHGMIGLF